MPAKCIAGAQRGLEIHRRASRELTQRGEVQGLARDICGEGLAADLDRGKTASGDTDAVADAYLGKLKARVDDEAHIPAALLERVDAADVLDDPGEHLAPLQPLAARFGRSRMRRSSPTGVASTKAKPRRLLEHGELRQLHQRTRAGPEQARRCVDEQLIGQLLPQQLPCQRAACLHQHLVDLKFPEPVEHGAEVV